MQLNVTQLAIPGLPATFYDVLNQALQPYPSPSNGCTRLTLNLFDPDYDMDRGGYHPVEISIVRHGEMWQLSYVTDFAYHGQPFPELVKEIDVDVEYGIVQHVFTRSHSLAAAAELTELFINNVIAYYHSGVYQLKLSGD